MLPAPGGEEGAGYPEEPDLSRRRTVFSYCLLSALAAVLLLLMAFTSSSEGAQLDIGSKLVVATAFMASCALGIVLGARPGFLRRRGMRDARTQAEGDRELPRLVAHHPDCGRFQDRVVSFRGRKWCGGCLGLVIGSSLALILMVTYLLLPDLEQEDGSPILMMGMLLVAISLMDLALDPRAGWRHVLANMVLVQGFFLVTVGALTATAELSVGLLAVVICFLWLDTRIQLSDWRHEKTCHACGRGCGPY